MYKRQKYATSEAGLKSFQKLEDLQSYFNEDYTATTYADACDKPSDGQSGNCYRRISVSYTHL